MIMMMYVCSTSRIIPFSYPFVAAFREAYQMNLNTTSLTPHSKDFLESMRQNWHYLLSGLVLPVIAVVSLAENALAIVVLLRVRPGRGIGATSRAYYMLLAAADIGSLLSCQLGKHFAEFAMRYLTGGRFYFSLPLKYLLSDY